MKPDTKSLTVYLPDTRGVTISRYGKGNMKIGMEVFTYSRLPGLPSQFALGYTLQGHAHLNSSYRGTCPGATPECLAICYAARPVAEAGAVRDMWHQNSQTADVPPIPDECRLLRIHVAGDFDTPEYIENWIRRLQERPDVTGWAYTRSWRIASLLEPLMRLHGLPNFTLWASMDPSTVELPPPGWRIAWIQGDRRLEDGGERDNHQTYTSPAAYAQADSLGMSYLCPEESGRVRDCVSCQYCFKGESKHVTFKRH